MAIQLRKARLSAPPTQKRTAGPLQHTCPRFPAILQQARLMVLSPDYMHRKCALKVNMCSLPQHLLQN